MKLDDVNPLPWFAGLLGTTMLGWMSFTSKKTLENTVKIATLETDVKYIREGIQDIKDHLGIKKEE